MSVLKGKDEDGRVSLHLTGGHLIGFLMLTVAVGPAIFYAGQLTRRVTAVETYVADQQAMQERYMEDHQVIVQLAESDRRIARALEETAKVVGQLQMDIAVLKERGRR